MSLLKIVTSKIRDKAAEESYPYFVYALFQTISNPIYYLLWYCFDNTTYESFTVRLIINILCIPLLFHRYWSAKFLDLLPYYWYITILYSLPFFFTFMLLKNNFSYEWSLNSLTGFVLCIIFIDISSLLVLLPIGVGLGILCYDFTTSQPFYPLDRIQPVLITYSSIIIFGKLFLTRNSIIQKEKQQSLRMQAAAIAHEMRTPLSAVNLMAKALKLYLPSLIKAQRLTQDKDKEVQFINPKKLEYLEEIPTELEGVTKNTFAVIDTLLINLQEVPKKITAEKCFIADCVKSALTAYALTEQEQELISLEIIENFELEANLQLLQHVFFNLLKNSLHYVKAAGKGKIYIWTETGEKVNELHFKDTGQGISPTILPYIFDQFYSRTDHGTGVGLAFCKMVMRRLGGDITCHSIEGEFSHFILSFPRVKR
ncbi:sensor histidine kinase [Candidatus Odyssella thessalonicensis]|uniref:sensor histidine kinase n=1 Tax=Candidatus Odyssella thessalonicensis TaxID=84647 RepID=UPI000225BFCE|nr:HAMP domain-containing sensor histidine kinase [Candidatus Odyssella thessalonicensis]